MTDCLFCQIVDKTLESTLVYEDDQVIAFDDRYPKAPIHQLIVPKKHIATINDTADQDTQLLGHMMQVAKQQAKRSEIADTGYRLVFNVNQGGGQVIFHIHLHLLGGRDLNWPPG
ncbi:MAG: HIT domain-containing protein [Legionellales bacterium]|nr:HIT domain-containing protein [Legionellales bacterium]